MANVRSAAVSHETCCCGRCLGALGDLKLPTVDEQHGVDIVSKALRSPCATIAKNAGVDPSLVVQKILSATNPSEGFDALRGTYVDMIQEGSTVRLL